MPHMRLLYCGLIANTGLNDTHFNSFHIYRVEWELPGAGAGAATEDGEGVSVESQGYIKW